MNAVIIDVPLPGKYRELVLDIIKVALLTLTFQLVAGKSVLTVLQDNSYWRALAYGSLGLLGYHVLVNDILVLQFSA